MIKHKKYGTPDKDNPEWTKEMFARSMKFKDLPESLQRTLSKPKRIPGAEPPSGLGSLLPERKPGHVSEATTTEDSLREMKTVSLIASE